MKLFSARPRKITSQILLAVLLPVVIVTVAIITYYSWERYSDLQRTERLLGELGAGYLAQAAELAIYAGDSNQLREQARKLRELARIARQRASLARVCFLDSNARILVQEGRALQVSCDAHLDKRQLVVKSHTDSIQFSWPIERTQLQVVDFDDGQGDEPADAPVGWVVLSLDNQNLLDASREVLASATLLGLVGVLTGVLFALRAGGTIGGPVRALTRHVRQLDTRAPSIVFPPQGTEEVITLANGLNRLVESVNRHIVQQKQRIDSATASLVRRNRQLEETHQVLERALQTKSDFLARMSHELRTPLTTIIGFNRLMLESDSPLQRREYIRHVEHASLLLQSIIEDILDYSRLQSAELQLESIAFNLYDCFEEVVGLHGYEAIGKRLELVLLLDHDVPRTVIGDALRLKQVLNNLLSNAIKFTDRGDVVVHVGALESPAGILVLQCEVSDTGVGVNADNYNQLFQPFTQADNSISRKYGGTGLGLAICQSLVQLMGGEISLSSEPGQGTRVVFSITVKVDSDTRDQPFPAALATRSLLGYDSNPSARRALHNTLIGWSHDVTVCETPATLLQQLQSSTPDLLLVGLSHAEAGSQPLLSLLSRIRARYGGPIVFMSVDPDLAKHIKGAGVATTAIDFALKPLRRQSLFAQCCRLVQTGTAQLQETAKQSARLAGLQLLVAEDHPSISELLVQVLSRHGAKVTAVADGQQAIDACADANYDLLLIDLHMPQLDGLSTISLLRQQGNETPIICVTADVTAAERQALSWAGADAIILKPIDESTLLEAICQRCGCAGAPTTGAEDAPKSPERAAPGEASAQLQQQLLQTLQRCRHAFEAGDAKTRKAALHDMLGLAGIFQENMLYALVREIAAEADTLAPADAGQLLDEAERLIRKY